MDRPSEMEVSVDDIMRILKLMEESGWDEIELTTKSFKFRAGKNLPPDYHAAPAQPSGPLAPAEEKPHVAGDGKPGNAAAAPVYQPEATPAGTPGVSAQADGTPVLSPMMGMFYRSPSPGAPPFVEVGDIVTEHSIVGIIEVMKVMSSVEAGLNGRITSILIENGQLVQYKEPLLLVDCAGEHAEAAHG